MNEIKLQGLARKKKAQKPASGARLKRKHCHRRLTIEMLLGNYVYQQLLQEKEVYREI